MGRVSIHSISGILESRNKFVDRIEILRILPVGSEVDELAALGAFRHQLRKLGCGGDGGRDACDNGHGYGLTFADIGLSVKYRTMIPATLTIPMMAAASFA